MYVYWDTSYACHTSKSGRALSAEKSVIVSRWPAEDHWLVFGQPGVEEGLMADSVQGGHHNVRGTNLMGLNLYLRNFVIPLSPLTLDRNLHKWFTEKKKA